MFGSSLHTELQTCTCSSLAVSPQSNRRLGNTLL
jgi:hypothetical protein